MTYENWCIHYKRILAEVDKYNTWRKEALHRVLAEAAPRLAELGKQFYCGCGFHYDKVQVLGKLVIHLALPWQVSANHCDKYEDGVCSTMTTEILFEELFEGLDKAEACVKHRQAGEQCTCIEDQRREEEERRRKQAERDKEG